MSIAALKAELADWEREFRAIHGRPPKVSDASETITAKYKELSRQLKATSKEPQNQIKTESILQQSTNKSTDASISSLQRLESFGHSAEFNIQTKSVSITNNQSKCILALPRVSNKGFDVPDIGIDDDNDVTNSISKEDGERKLAAAQDQNQDALSASKKSEKSVVKSTSVEVKYESSFAAFKPEENFVRINLKKDWRSKVSQGFVGKKKSRSKLKSKLNDRSNLTNDPDDAISTVLDILDGNDSSSKSVTDVPFCGHRLPCVEKIVKKASTGNKGRVFFSCSLGRDGSCGFFKWKDDSPKAVRDVFAKASIPNPKDPLKLEAPAWVPLLPVSELKRQIKRLGKRVGTGKKSELVTQLQKLWTTRAEETLALDRSSLDPQVVLEQVFMCSEFLCGQLEAIEQVLGGSNTLVVRATGSGKSLIYQLVSFMLEGITIVVSPLISLIQDQVSQLPPGLGGSGLSGSQKEQAETLAGVLNGRIKILFISPERLFTSSFQTFLKKAPKVSLVCVDEAHCISAWSHNFRPSYLRLGTAVNKLFPEAVVLALSATATVKVQQDICKRLGIDAIQGIQKTGQWLRKNLRLSIESAPASEDHRFVRLVEILSSGSFNTKESKRQKMSVKSSASPSSNVETTIIYTSTKNETETLAERLNARGFNTVAYHAGMEMSARMKAQADFIQGKVPIVIATVAFGMGLNKQNVRRVIHYRTPQSIENYVQEIGRGGRDGKDSNCICLLDASGEESKRSLSLARSDGIEISQILFFLKKLDDLSKPFTKSMASCFVDETVRDVDCRDAVLETLLVLLEEKGLIELGANGYGRADVEISRYSGDIPEVVKAVKQLLDRKAGISGQISLSQLAETISIASHRSFSISATIKLLCDARDSGFLSRVKLLDRCWFYNVTLHWKEAMQDCPCLAQDLKRRCDDIEILTCKKISAAFAILSSGMTDMEAMACKISSYLEENDDDKVSYSVPCAEFDDVVQRTLLGDVRSLLRDPAFLVHPEHVRTARAVVRIFHSVSSISFPTDSWRPHRLWGRYKQYSFDELLGFVSKHM